MSQPALSKHIAALERDLGRLLCAVAASRSRLRVKFLEACVSIVETYARRSPRFAEREGESYCLLSLAPCTSSASLVWSAAAGATGADPFDRRIVDPIPEPSVVRQGRLGHHFTLTRDDQSEIESWTVPLAPLCPRRPPPGARTGMYLRRVGRRDGAPRRRRHSIRLEASLPRSLNLTTYASNARSQCSIYDRHLDEVSNHPHQ